ncbi:MAG: hypothetical protein WD333_03435 [Dehalococcoidia bacterium]
MPKAVIRRVFPLLMIATALIITACESDDAVPTATVGTIVDAATPTPTAVVTQDASGLTSIDIHLSEPTGEYQTGRLVIKDEGESIRLIVDVSPPQPNAQPIHIHQGSCENVGDVLDVLQDVVNGHSETVVVRDLADITDGDHVVNIHLSASAFATYTACGDIPVLQE